MERETNIEMRTMNDNVDEEVELPVDLDGDGGNNESGVAILGNDECGVPILGSEGIPTPCGIGQHSAPHAPSKNGVLLPLLCFLFSAFTCFCFVALTAWGSVQISKYPLADQRCYFTGWNCNVNYTGGANFSGDSRLIFKYDPSHKGRVRFGGFPLNPNTTITAYYPLQKGSCTGWGNDRDDFCCFTSLAIGDVRNCWINTNDSSLIDDWSSHDRGSFGSIYMVPVVVGVVFTAICLATIGFMIYGMINWRK